MNFPDELPEHLWRYPTGAARESLAARFGLPLDDSDQDWEWTNSRPEQLPDCLAAYQSGELDDDERFTLMEMMIQCAEDEPEKVHLAEVLKSLETQVKLHLASVWYWACIGSEQEDSWDIAPGMRAILWRHRALWE